MRNLLIVGLGDVARRALPYLVRHWRVLAVTRSPQAARIARAGGALPVSANLDDWKSLQRVAGLAIDDVLITAPPPENGRTDPRMRKLLSAMTKADSIPQRLCYISTTGVYGDGGGEWLDETSPLRPQSDRAQRRADAEAALRAFSRRHGVQLTILRAPGIYAADRLPLRRLLDGLPLIRPEEDSFSNHIHADDLARLCVAGLLRVNGGLRCYNACDDEPLSVTDWYSQLADCFLLPLPEMLPREEVKQRVSPGLWSFLAESRRVDNTRLRRELKAVLRYPTVRVLLEELSADAGLRAEILAKAGKIR